MIFHQHIYTACYINEFSVSADQLHLIQVTYQLLRPVPALQLHPYRPMLRKNHLPHHLAELNRTLPDYTRIHVLYHYPFMAFV